MYGDMSSLRGKEKCVLTFSFIMVIMLNVYLIVLKHKMEGSLQKHALVSIKHICSYSLESIYLLQMFS